jgi:hypothetical protein
MKEAYAPLSSLMDSIVNPKVKIVKGEGVGVRSLVYSTSRWKGMLELQNGTRKIDKQLDYSHKPTQTKQQVG